jgi:hypothetical protein
VADRQGQLSDRLKVVRGHAGNTLDRGVGEHQRLEGDHPLKVDHGHRPALLEHPGAGRNGLQPGEVANQLGGHRGHQIGLVDTDRASGDRVAGLSDSAALPVGQLNAGPVRHQDVLAMLGR